MSTLIEIKVNCWGEVSEISTCEIDLSVIGWREALFKKKKKNSQNSRPKFLVFKFKDLFVKMV